MQISVPRLSCFLVRAVALIMLIQTHGVFARDLRVGLVLDKGGRRDRSFNESALEGLQKAKKELGVQVKDVVATDDTAFERIHLRFARKGYDVIIGIGFAQRDAVANVAKKFPNTRFALVDSSVDLPNVKSLLFEEHQGAFLVGALAAMQSAGSTVGFVGGMDIPLIRRFLLGYEAGARHIDPKAKVKTNFVGVTGSAWNNPPRAKELAMSQYQSGIEVVFVAAGASGMGVFDAAEEMTARLNKKHYVIGVDSNQNWVKPGLVLTSMLKRVDLAVFKMIADAQRGEFVAGATVSNFHNGGIDYAVDQYNKDLISDEQMVRLDQLKHKIMTGEVKVPDYYQQQTQD